MSYTILSLVLLAMAAQSTSRTPKLVMTGQIERVDTLAKSFEMKSQQEVNNQPAVTDGITIGTTIGKLPPTDNRTSTDSPGRTFPDGLPSTRPTFPNDTSRQPRPTIRTRVFIEESTVCKDRSKVILCGELKANDLLQVTGQERSDTRGFGFYATEIVRTRQVK
jgi:hypothetical protein